jgi:hypothetical protein
MGIIDYYQLPSLDLFVSWKLVLDYIRLEFTYSRLNAFKYFVLGRFHVPLCIHHMVCKKLNMSR